MRSDNYPYRLRGQPAPKPRPDESQPPRRVQDDPRREPLEAPGTYRKMPIRYD